MDGHWPGGQVLVALHFRPSHRLSSNSQRRRLQVLSPGISRGETWRRNKITLRGREFGVKLCGSSIFTKTPDSRNEELAEGLVTCTGSHRELFQCKLVKYYLILHPSFKTAILTSLVEIVSHTTTLYSLSNIEVFVLLCTSPHTLINNWTSRSSRHCAHSWGSSSTCRYLISHGNVPLSYLK